MAVGGVAIAAAAYPEIVERLLEIRGRLGASTWTEVKWANCKRDGGRLHKTFVDYFFQLISENRLHFHVCFSEVNAYDHSLSVDRKHIDTVSKAYWQLIVHRPCRYYGSTHVLYIRPDGGDCTALLAAMIDNMNHHASCRYNYCSRAPIAHIECADSAKEPMLQFMDVCLGALASYRNGRREHSDANVIRTELATYVFKRTEASHIAGNTPLARHNLSIWNVVPQWQTRGPRG